MTGRERRTLALGIGTVAVATLLLRGAPTLVRTVGRTESEIAARTELIQRAHEQLAQRDVLADSVDRAQEAIGRLTARALIGDTEDQALLDLGRRVAQALETLAAAFEGVVPGEPQEGGGIVQLMAATARFQTDVQGLMDALRAMEGDSALIVSGVRVTAAAPHAGMDEPETLLVEVDVGGWYLRREARADGAPAGGGP